MNCADFEIRLADYLDDMLDASEREAIEEHAAACAGCGELLAGAEEGLKVLRVADDVVPPADLLTRISYLAPAGRIRHPFERQGFLSKWLQPILQPRLAMGMAMTILSFAMLERCTGVHVQHIQAADLSPVRIWGGVEDKTMRLKDRAVKYYENLRWVYEIEVRLGALQGQDNGDGQNASPSGGTPANSKTQAEKDRKK
jgi:Putative zinc-finger